LTVKFKLVLRKILLANKSGLLGSPFIVTTNFLDRCCSRIPSYLSFHFQ